jgi:predicted NBD/HSP70 family sugar kinase
MYIAVDIGGTKTQVAGFTAIDPKSQTKLHEYPTPRQYDQALKQLVHHIQLLSPKNLSGIGISLAAHIDTSHTVTSRSNLPDYRGHQLLEDLKQQGFHAPQMRLVNDALAAAHAQIAYTHLSPPSLLHLVIGTGVGGAYLVKQSGNYLGIPLEPGWMIVHPGGLPHTLSQLKGVLEAYVGGAQLSAQLSRPLNDVTDADRIWDQVTNYFGMSLYNLTVLLKPHTITLSGGLIENRPFLAPGLTTYLEQFKEQIDVPTISLSTVKNPSLLGALVVLST